MTSGCRDESVVNVRAGAALVVVVGPHVDEFDALRTGDLFEASDALHGVVGAGVADEAHALAAVRQGLDGDFAGILAELGVGRADVKRPGSSSPHRCRT